MNNELAKLKELAQARDLLIANGQLTADLLRHLADNEIDSDYFAAVSGRESYGKVIDAELSITEFALRAAGHVDALIERLEAAEAELAAIKGEQKADIKDTIAAIEALRNKLSECSRLNYCESAVAMVEAELRQRDERIEELTIELAAIKGDQEPIGYIDSASLREYRGVKAGGSWSALPKTGEYNQTTPIYIHPAPAVLPPDPGGDRG